MQKDLFDENESKVILVDFGSIPIDTVSEKTVTFKNFSNVPISYRVSSMYALNNVDSVFDASITSSCVSPSKRAVLTVVFKPQLADQSFTEYYIVDDTSRNNFRVTVTGKCFGPKVTINERKLVFRICKNVSEQRSQMINITNRSSVDTTYQWLLPHCGQGHFQMSTGNCGMIRAFETIRTNVLFTGSALGVYTYEMVCMILNQEPLFLDVIATVMQPDNPLFNIHDHVFHKNWKRKSRMTHLMENSLNQLSYVPSASVCERYLDFGRGSVSDMTKNISQILNVTNHLMPSSAEDDGFIQWMPDSDNIFQVDPIACVIPPNESRLFTVRFRPKVQNNVYSYLMCGDYQHKVIVNGERKLQHTWFRIPCIGNTWLPCNEWTTNWDCPTEITLPPTSPTKTTFKNFMLSNKLDVPMYFKFHAPDGSRFVIMPMCGIVQSRGWEIISVALETKTCGDFYENWDLIVNKTQKVRIRLCGNAEKSNVELMSHGLSPDYDALYEFEPTITGTTNYCTAYMHNITRMPIHIRVLNSAPWLGADNQGSIVLPPKTVVPFSWWFFPKVPDTVYETKVTLTCVCLINDRPVGEPTEISILITGFSELPDLRVLPKKLNLHDIVVWNSATVSVTLYNFGSCHFTSKLYHETGGMGDDWGGDRLEIDAAVNSVMPSRPCTVSLTVTPDGAGSRQVDIKYTVLFHNENNEVNEIQPITKKICTVWYDGIYPSIKVKRTISMKCPVILSNHCAWNIVNVEALNKAFMDCRPNKPINVNLYAPDLCHHSGKVKMIFVLGCVYQVPVAWSLRREKICDCAMVEVPLGISTYEMRHNCPHRELVELSPLSGIVAPDSVNLLHLTFDYRIDGNNTLCYVMTMPNLRTMYIYLNMLAHPESKGILTPLRRVIGNTEYLAVLDCGRVPINNLDPVIRIVWLYNPTDVFTTWRLLRGNTIAPVKKVLRCLLYFAEVPPLGKLAIPFAFMPTEMIDYKVTFFCSFGYDTVKLFVEGQGGLPNCVETRLDIPTYVERVARASHRDNIIYLSKEHITVPELPTHSLSRDILAICNDTDHLIRFIWLPERIANIVNVVMTPCWGVLQPKSTEWITMTVYTLQEPATFTTTVACELLDLTKRRKFQTNELLRRNKAEKCYQEFIITEQGTFNPGINDCPPYVLDIVKPQPFYISMSVSVSSKGQRDGYTRMLLKQMWEHVCSSARASSSSNFQTPPYDLHSSDLLDHSGSGDRGAASNHMTLTDVIRIIDGILWDALHSKMFKNQIQYFAKQEIPTYNQLVKVLNSDLKQRLSRRVTSGICDAIVNKAVFHVYNLNPKQESASVMDI